MSLLFKPRTPKFTAIKLYCLGEPSDRKELVSRILTSLQSAFGAFPTEFDIHGPYQIKKGTTVGLQSFQNKLAKHGHEKYYALSGETGEQFGFDLLLGARFDQLLYSELILWYASEQYTANFLELVEPLLEPFNACCGFENDIQSGHSINSETKVKRSIFGSISIVVSKKHLSWLPSVREGGIRGLFKHNIVNCDQLSRLALEKKETAKPVANGLYYVSSQECWCGD